MPIKVPDHLPAKEVLINENIFVMDESRAFQQDIRPLQIGILNLMPDKKTTEEQLLRLLGNTPLQIEITLVHMMSYTPKNTPKEHLRAFYKTFDSIKGQKFDGFIITGAPVEHFAFEEVAYWEELKAVMDWTTHNVTSTYYICWGAQAALYYFYGIEKYRLDHKLFGIFEHTITNQSLDLFRGFDDVFHVPHSRHTGISREAIEKIADIIILSESREAGVYIAATKDYSKIFVTGHSEYDPETLKNEYQRDLNKGEDIRLPVNYFRDNNPQNPPVVRWRSHASLLYNNWLNLVYQRTPYHIEDVGNIL